MTGSPGELESLRSMLGIARTLTLVFLILFLILFGFVTFAIPFGFVFGFFFLIPFILQLVIYVQISGILDLIGQGQYVRAKEKTLIWMILGFIFGGILIGVFLLLAYIKFDPVINWQRQAGQFGQMSMAWGQPTLPPSQPIAWSPTPAPPPAPSAAICPRCGKPATWIAQYNRWYCYSDGQYL